MKFETDAHNVEKMNEWLQEHIETCAYWQPNNHGILPQGANGGAITYLFTPTTTGLVVEVQCCCGQKTNVTNYDEW